MKKLAVFICAICAALLFLSPAKLENELYVYHKNVNKKWYSDRAKSIEQAPALKDDLLRVDFINIRLGDSILLRCGNETMLIDGGVWYRYELVLEYLKNEGIDHLDYMFNTHAHNDHIDVQRKLLEGGFSVGMYLSKHAKDEELETVQSVVSLLNMRGIPFKQVKPGDSMKLGGATLTFLGDNISTVADFNQRSLMTHIQFGNRSILLTADVIGESQSVIADNFKDYMKADIMQAPHHGYNLFHNNRLINDVNPELIVITYSPEGTQNLESVLKDRRMPRYYIINGDVRLETDGNVWYATQGK